MLAPFLHPHRRILLASVLLLISTRLAAATTDALLVELDVFLADSLEDTDIGFAKRDLFLFSVLGGGRGYTDNAFYASEGTRSAFWHLTSELFGILDTERYGSFQGIFFYDEYRHDESWIPSELSIYVDLDWSYPVSGYTLMLGPSFSHSQYFFDPFEVDGRPNAVVLRENRTGVDLGLDFELSKDWQLELEWSVSAPRYGGTSDDYNVYRFDWFLSWNESQRTQWRLRFAYAKDDYLDAQERSRSGSIIDETWLHIDRYIAELRWENAGQGRRGYDLSLPLRFELKKDSGGGYYDRWQAGIHPDVDWVWLGFDFELAGSIQYMEYLDRVVSTLDDSNPWLWKTDVSFEVSRLIRHYRLWGRVSWKDYDAKVESWSYLVRTMEAGVSVEF